MGSTTTDMDTDGLPGHVEAVLVALAMLAPIGFVVLLVGPRAPAVLLGVVMYLAVLVVGGVVAGALEAL